MEGRAFPPFFTTSAVPALPSHPCPLADVGPTSQAPSSGDIPWPTCCQTNSCPPVDIALSFVESLLEGFQNFGSDRFGQFGRLDYSRQPVAVGMAKARRLHKQAAIRLIDDADALHRHGNPGEKDFRAGQAKQAPTIPGTLKTQQGEVDGRGLRSVVAGVSVAASAGGMMPS